MPTPVTAAPQDFPPPPRTVRWRRVNVQAFVSRYLFTPALLLMLTAAAVMISTALFGERSEGRITGIRTQKMSDNGATAHFAGYAFDVNGKHFQSEQRIFDYSISPWTPGTSVIVRSANILGYRYSTLADGWGDLINLNAYAIYMVVLVIAIGLPSAGYRGWIVPGRQKRLLRDGVITAGAIEELPPGPQFKCKYSYADATAQKYTSRMSIPPTLAVRMNAGDPLTIAYDPDRPKRHIVYDFCDFLIVSA